MNTFVCWIHETHACVALRSISQTVQCNKLVLWGTSLLPQHSTAQHSTMPQRAQQDFFKSHSLSFAIDFSSSSALCNIHVQHQLQPPECVETGGTGADCLLWLIHRRQLLEPADLNHSQPRLPGEHSRGRCSSGGSLLHDLPPAHGESILSPSQNAALLFVVCLSLM